MCCYVSSLFLIYFQSKDPDGFLREDFVQKWNKGFQIDALASALETQKLLSAI